MAIVALGLAPFGCFFTVADLEEGSGNGGGGAGGGGNGGAGGSGNGGGAGGSAVTSGSGGGAPACDAGGPCAPLLPSASFVLRTAGPGQCPAGAVALEYTGCNDHEQDCSCTAAGSGTCDIAADGHTSSVCTNGSVELPTGNACNTSLNVSADGGDTTSVSATVTVSGSLTCDPTPTDVPSNLEHGCVIEPVGGCGPGRVCLPPGTDDHCLLVPDGGKCPPPYLTKRIITTTGEPPFCKCRCDQCADVTVTVYEGEDCLGPSVTFLPDPGGICVATPFVTVGSAYVPAGSPAYCTAFAKPAGLALDTLCCPD